MKTVLLMRHAKSSWEDEKLKDIDRPLLRVGIERTHKVLEQLKKHKISIEQIISSPALRAIETTHLVMEQMHQDNLIFKTDLRLYGHNQDSIFELLNEVHNDINVLLLIGHNPSLSEFARKLYSKREYDLPTSAIAAICFPTDSWEKIKETKGKELFYLTPKTIKK